MLSDYEKELETIQKWIKRAANLNSYKLSEAPPKVTRPVILWEPPSRSKNRNLSAYQYVTAVRQYGKLFVKGLDGLNQVETALIQDLEERGGVLSIMDGTAVIGQLMAVEISFENTSGLDVPFSVSYEVTYTKAKPAAAPPATSVYTRAVINLP